MNSLLKLVNDADGTVSRTQLTLMILFLYSLILIPLEIIFKQILTIPVGITLCMLFVFAFIDRLNASRLNLSVNKSGVQIEAHNSTEDKKQSVNNE